MTDDMELLQEYARRNSEQAFAALVSRHINLVYSVALRQTGAAHLAEEITQTVFIILARKASSLGSKTILAGWLCRTARYASANVLTVQRRRQNREQEAHMQSVLNEPESDAWTKISPLLDGALEHLGEKDHNAIVLRFFEGKDLKQVGAALGTGEDAAKMRVHRALEKLRGYLTKRGVALPAAALTAAISANAVQAAPAGLAVTISATTVKGAAVAASVTALVNGTIKTITMTTIQKAFITAAIIVAAGAGIYEAREASTLRAQIQTLQQQQAPLSDQNQQLQRERDDATNGLAMLADETAKNKRDNVELLRLRGEIGLLKQNAASLSNKLARASNPYGLSGEEMPPVTSSGVPDTASAYARLVKKLATGQLTAAEEFNLLKAWPYLEKRFPEAEGFAQFQSQYLADMLNVTNKDTVWQIRRLLESARGQELGQGLRWARQSDEQLQHYNLNLDIQKIREQWNTLNQKTTQQILEVLNEQQQPNLTAMSWPVLDFDSRLKPSSQPSLNDPRFQNLTSQEILEGFIPPNLNHHFVPATPLSPPNQ